MAKYVNAKQLARRFMSKNKDKLRLSTIINEIEIAEKGLSLEIDVVEVVRCKDCKYSEIADDGRFRKKIYCFQPAPIKQIVETEENRFCSYGKRKGDE